MEATIVHRSVVSVNLLTQLTLACEYINTGVFDLIIRKFALPYGSVYQGLLTRDLSQQSLILQLVLYFMFVNLFYNVIKMEINKLK